MKVPDWYVLVLLALASFRTWRLLAEDDITDPLRRYVTALPKEWEKEGDPLPGNYRLRLNAFLTCPWCLGFWLALAWWGAWEISPHWVTIAAVPMALSALVPLLSRASSPE